LGVLEAALLVGAMYLVVQKKKSGVFASLAELEKKAVEKEEILRNVERIYSGMIDLGSVREKAKEFFALQESLKVERGRITITQAELETVENRLRELEEIERELEASGLETQEELRILEKRQGELKEKNDALKKQIDEALEQLETVLTNFELSSQSQMQIESMKAELIQTQQQIDTLLIKIETGNEQYFELKKRYDALDIEYAQLYEKFAEVDR